MRSASFHLTTVLLVAGFASCARPPAFPNTSTAVAKPGARSVAKPVPKPVAKRPVLMNGRGKTTSISLMELFALQQAGNVLLYDARPRFFYHLGHLPGAISLPKDRGDAEIDQHEAEIKAAVAANKPIVVYCTNFLCPDARTLATHLADHGYSSSTMAGGWESWKEAGLPTE